MRIVTERDVLANGVAELDATRQALTERLRRTLTALSLAADAQALSQERLEAFADDAEQPRTTIDELRRLADGYRRMRFGLFSAEDAVDDERLA